MYNLELNHVCVYLLEYGSFQILTLFLFWLLLYHALRILLFLMLVFEVL